MVSKVKVVQEVEAHYGKPLEQLLPEIYRERAPQGSGPDLGRSDGADWYQLLKFGMTVRRAVVAPGVNPESASPHRARPARKPKQQKGWKGPTDLDVGTSASVPIDASSGPP